MRGIRYPIAFKKAAKPYVKIKYIDTQISQLTLDGLNGQQQPESQEWIYLSSVLADALP